LVNPEDLGEILSSRARVKIADALSVRPRTLGELATATGISVQGVLRHLKMMAELGVVEERKMTSKAPKARRLYAAKGTAFGDYSAAGLTVVKSTEKWPSQGYGRRKAQDLEKMSGELVLKRRRIREEALKIGRMIDELADDQQALEAVLDEMPLSDEERLILEVVLTEETTGEGLRVLSRYYGIDDRRSIDKALAVAKRNVDK
jgi:DNA-binding transcriptional ArsR family regulator